ncbi:hypothetical protein HMN09_00817800 [Mycena chlorophos]|uniref:Uncharacterized protein n=1 Tax=Mycena chlorophos TaxID=658473 RepID=A0A8H6W5I3_MYCCL|nr:hypothetical protein HMN09_00817800 [Mycena chlorophos]
MMAIHATSDCVIGAWLSGGGSLGNGIQRILLPATTLDAHSRRSFATTMNSGGYWLPADRGGVWDGFLGSGSAEPVEGTDLLAEAMLDSTAFLFPTAPENDTPSATGEIAQTTNAGMDEFQEYMDFLHGPRMDTDALSRPPSSASSMGASEWTTGSPFGAMSVPIDPEDWAAAYAYQSHTPGSTTSDHLPMRDWSTAPSDYSGELPYAPSPSLPDWDPVYNLGQLFSFSDSDTGLGSEVLPMTELGGDPTSLPDDAIGQPLTDFEVAAALGPAATTEDGLLGARWVESSTVWLEPDVSSRVVYFPHDKPFYYTTKSKVEAIEKVSGVPSRFPIPATPTLFVVDYRNVDGIDENMTVDAIFKDREVHSYTGSSGARDVPDAYLPGEIFGLPKGTMVACRRIEAKCRGVNGCDALGDVFLKTERRALDPHERDQLVDAETRLREMQDTTDVGQVLAFVTAMERWCCRATLADGTRCPGKPEMVVTTQTFRNKDHIILCSHRSSERAQASQSHTAVQIPDRIDETLLGKAMRNESLVEGEDGKEQPVCARVTSRRSGSKGIATCPFGHIHDGRRFSAQVKPLTCKAKYILFAPWEELHPDIKRMLIVIPDPANGHTHPPPPPTKLTNAVRDIYKECVRRFGVTATPGRVDRAASTIAILGTTPALYHPALVSRDTRSRLVQEVKRELLGSMGNVNQQLSAYLDEQRRLDASEKFVQSYFELDGKRIIIGVRAALLQFIHRARTLDCDTTFKPLASPDMNIFEINVWLPGINRMVTIGRVWMEVHTRHMFRHLWQELQRIVLRLTRKALAFRGLHGLDSTVGAAISSTDDVLSRVLRVCHTHVQRGLPETDHLSAEDAARIRNFMYLPTVADVDAFKLWIQTVDDPNKKISAWWKHKLSHTWLLPGTIRCLSGIPGDVWDQMPATTNAGEAQHAHNNAETGTGMGVLESFQTCDKFSTRDAAEIKQAFDLAVLVNPRNELVDRFGSMIRRHTATTEKAKRASEVDDAVRALQQQQRELKAAEAEVKRQLAKAKAEAKSNSSGKVRPPPRAARSAVGPSTRPPSPEPEDPEPQEPEPTETVTDAASLPPAPSRPLKRKASNSDTIPQVSSRGRVIKKRERRD